jgi:hypothetical protein
MQAVNTPVPFAAIVQHRGVVVPQPYQAFLAVGEQVITLACRFRTAHTSRNGLGVTTPVQRDALQELGAELIAAPEFCERVDNCPPKLYGRRTSSVEKR